MVSGSESNRWPCLCLADFANAVPEYKSRCRSLPQTSACLVVHLFSTKDILEGARQMRRWEVGRSNPKKKDWWVAEGGRWDCFLLYSPLNFRFTTPASQPHVTRDYSSNQIMMPIKNQNEKKTALWQETADRNTAAWKTNLPYSGNNTPCWLTKLIDDTFLDVDAL